MKRIFLKLLFVYKYTAALFIGGRCRFYPTCSEYALHAVKKLPLHKAIYLIIKRILRCNPLFQGGVDFLP